MKSQNAFTVIELTFAIVIVGLLAAIAIAKLAATRSDALGTVIANDLATCINEAGNEYVKSGSFHHRTQDDNMTVACKHARQCFAISESDLNGTLLIQNLSTSRKECLEAQNIAATNLLVGTTKISF